MRFAARGLRFAILAVFAAFFVVPLAWLILAPTKSDEALVTSAPLALRKSSREKSLSCHTVLIVGSLPPSSAPPA